MSRGKRVHIGAARARTRSRHPETPPVFCTGGSTAVATRPVLLMRWRSEQPPRNRPPASTRGRSRTRSGHFSLRTSASPLTWSALSSNPRATTIELNARFYASSASTCANPLCQSVNSSHWDSVVQVSQSGNSEGLSWRSRRRCPKVRTALRWLSGSPEAPALSA
jgi:hypothetical protein